MPDGKLYDPSQSFLGALSVRSQTEDRKSLIYLAFNL